MSLHELLRRGRGASRRWCLVYLSVFYGGRLDYYQNSLLKSSWTVEELDWPADKDEGWLGTAGARVNIYGVGTSP